ncbi:sigma-54-dependent transcriptional regulator [Amphritea balenae]|uniref:Sigma-54-dependent Fis family transcriptional regulator n=1 Tax=Amphritea balenae TaxID=452629 RepID=A0A3P1SQ07_9GAMM|nr:sigma-54 dependent transcriptional regulator [Amphritea balenae]RRC99246.1 sigma-54-dependent Fis family transcriptional regulator [Amphritea balenae]GGK72763.1 sigma-54-dependent Fis family transcriptional regulator [Amphritea balenae]
MSIQVLVVEDDADLREALVDTLELAGFEYLEADSGEAALDMLAEYPVDMVVSDVNMGGMDGHQLLEKIQQAHPCLPVMLITAYGQVNKAVDAIRSGAVDYLMKPFAPEALIEVVKRYTGSHIKIEENLQPVAEESSSKQLLQVARRVAETDSTVLITGESGTGKEVLAQYIHMHSPRAEKPFIAINCAAIPENMLEATLFGHEKGAFTGAYTSNPGKFEQANGGTILLDEISEMDLGLQAKLLRVLQEQQVERVGGRKIINLDVRILATTNRKLEEYVAENKFREDLYYRLNVFPLQWLPLRERTADIVPLAQRLLAKYSVKMNRTSVTLSDDAQKVLQSFGWPGNVRELDNIIQRALILQQGALIGAADLHIQPGSLHTSEVAGRIGQVPVAEESGQLGSDMKQHEFQLIVDTLRDTGGSRKEASEKLGISPRTLRYKLAKMREAGIDLDAELSV